MKRVKNILTLIILCFSYVMVAQETEVSEDTKPDKTTYYQNRAEEDAKFEQQFTAENKNEEKAFWKEQKRYEKDLKKRDRVAYNAYMKGKRDAYREHYAHCDHHCHHSHYYYSHASFYYDGYYYRYERYPRYNSVNARVRVATPSVGLSLF